jgi:hypothetical protein
VKVKDIVRQRETLAGAAMYFLALGECTKAVRLLRRANLLRASPEIARILSEMNAGDNSQGEE